MCRNYVTSNQRQFLFAPSFLRVEICKLKKKRAFTRGGLDTGVE